MFNIPKEKAVPLGCVTPAPVTEQPMMITGNWREFRPVLEPEKCDLCMDCVVVCPDASFQLDEAGGGGGLGGKAGEGGGLGELEAGTAHAAGDHAQLAVVLGAAAAGARALTGSSGVGVTYAFENYSPIAGGRIPLQMMIADRALDPPGDFGAEHTDAMSCRDQGWLMGWAESPQEAFDNCLINYRVGEDHRVLLPQFVCQDGYFVSHIPGMVNIPDQAQV